MNLNLPRMKFVIAASDSALSNQIEYYDSLSQSTAKTLTDLGIWL